MTVLIRADDQYWSDLQQGVADPSQTGLSPARLTQLLRHHRPAQFAWRVLRRSQQRMQRALPNHFAVPDSLSAELNADRLGGLVSIADQRSNLWPSRHQSVSKMTAGIFCALNQCVELSDDRGNIDWDVDQPRLWRFHLQSQEALLQLAEQSDPAEAFRWIESWLAFPKHRQPGIDPDAWHPFCVSRRLPVWLGLAARYGVPAQIAKEFSSALARQVYHLRRNLEWDLGGNHLLENLASLYLAETYLRFDRSSELPQVERWLLEQCEVQVLESGEHVERTPTYHALMLVSLLQCVQAAKEAGRDAYGQLAATATRMLGFLNDVQQPNGDLPLLGDSGLDEMPSLARLQNWAQAILPQVDQGSEPNAARHRALAADYCVFTHGEDHQLLFDRGALACDHLPAHGHADLLNVTACFHGATALVDTGNFEYEPTLKRHYCRSTAAHNVLQVDDREQADLFGSFRMGRRGRIRSRHSGTLMSVEKPRNYRWASAIHDGFGFPVGRCVLETDTGWLIADWCCANDAVKFATSRLQWHPEWELEETSSHQVTARHQAGEVFIEWLGAQTQAKVMPAVYCPGFGQAYQSRSLVAKTPLATQRWIAVHLQLEADRSTNAPTVSMSGGRIGLRIAGCSTLELHDQTGAEVN